MRNFKEGIGRCPYQRQMRSKGALMVADDETPLCRSTHHHWFSCVILTIALSTSALGDEPLTVTEFPDVQPHDAAMVLEADAALIGNAQVLRCRDGQRVGMWLKPGAQLSNIIITNCLVPVVSEGGGADLSHLTLQGAVGTPEFPALLREIGMQGMTALSVCLWLRGAQGTVVANNASNCHFGAYVSGHQYRIQGNIFHHNAYDGLTLLGDRNEVTENNQLLSNKMNGINVVQQVGQLSSTWLVKGLPDLAAGNLIRGNTATGNGLDLREWPVGSICTQPINTWENNTANKRNPTCLQ
jgi:hypothetical protein